MMIAAELQNEMRSALLPEEEPFLPVRGAAAAGGCVDCAGDDELAGAVARALQANRVIPRDQIRASVRNGWVTLEGEVEWLYQWFEAYDTVCHLRGIAGCSTRISVKAHPAHLGTGDTHG